MKKPPDDTVKDKIRNHVDSFSRFIAFSVTKITSVE